VETQAQIKRTLSAPAALTYVRDQAASGRFLHRTALADFLCEHFKFRDARGARQRSGCLKALRELAARGDIELPLPRLRPGPWRPRRLENPVPPPTEVPTDVSKVKELELVLVTTEAEHRLWTELMIGEHPRGVGPLVGRQVRYLIKSAHGWLGAVGFGAGALHLAARDGWIGWTEGQRRRQLHRVVGLSRLLIRPCVRCQNLASRVLSLCLRRLAEDFSQRYGFAPWLVESFADRAQVRGTVYRAGNWICVGQTAGRGRQDRERRCAESIKDIYLYPLEPDFRGKIGVPADRGGSPLGPAEGVDGIDWTANEFGNARLGDARLTRRLVESARMKAEDPGEAFTHVAAGYPAAIKGYYRLIDHPDGEAVNAATILAPHRERTVRRMQAQRTVLCVQDGTDVDYNQLAECEGLGIIGTNQTGAKSRGLHLHTVFAVSPTGLPLGILDVQCNAPQPRPVNDKRSAAQIPIEEKETFAWIKGFRETLSVAKAIPNTQVIAVCDREADFFELFDEQRQHPRVELLVRAKHNRALVTEPAKLFDAVRHSPILADVRVHVPRQSARPKRSKQKARPARPGRVGDFAVRARRVRLLSPEVHRAKAPIEIWVVHACEQTPPPGAKAIEWFLLTTLDCTTPEQAITCLRWYCYRWRIEDWHRVLKSGCRIEELAHDTADRLRRAIAINAVIAWRVMLMTLLGRETPNLPAEVLFSDLQLQVLYAFARKRKLPPPALLGDAVRLTARLGGYMGRTHDPPPGHQLMWKGYTRLQEWCEGFALRDG
jgi:hypothetical protein